MTPVAIAETAIGAIASLLVFFSFFMGILVWLIVTSRTGRWKRDARMPLDDGAPSLKRQESHQDRTNV